MNKIYKYVLSLTFLILFLKKFDFFRTLGIAYFFGSNNETDAIFVSISIVMLFNMIALKSFSEGIIPYLNTNFSKSYFKHKFLLIVGASLIFNIVLFFFSKLITRLVAPGFEGESVIVAVDSLKIFSFSILPILLSSLLAAYLSYLKFYNHAHLGDFVRNIILIIILFLWHKNVYIISYGWLIGSWLGFFILLIVFFSKVYMNLTHSTNRFKLSDSGIFYTVFINVLIYITVIIDKLFLSFTTSGNIANFTYADSVRSLILTTFVIATSRIFLVEFSYNTLKNIKPLINIFVFVTICAVVLFLFSYKLSEIIYYRGEISLIDIKIISGNLKFIAVSLPFYSMYQILSQKLFSEKKYWFLIKALLICVIIKIIICLLSFQKYQLYAVLTSKVVFEILISIIIVMYFIKNKRPKFSICS